MIFSMLKIDNIQLLEMFTNGFKPLVCEANITDYGNVFVFRVLANGKPLRKDVEKLVTDLTHNPNRALQIIASMKLELKRDGYEFDC